MTTKHLAIGLTIFPLAVIAAFRLGAQQEVGSSSNGRYALVQGEYMFVPSKGAIVSEHGLFRVDTTSGQTWRFVFHDAETYWDPIDVAQAKNRR
jgi:hypothetical protein